jgi:para-nitrobenzyl esterase
MRRFSMAAIFVLLYATVSGPGRAADPQAGSCFATTANGDMQGVDRGASCAFLGIPFAAPPIGSLRWRRPQPAQPWAPLTLNATGLPRSCPQLNVATGLPSGDENCLQLNVWTPNPLPVSGAPVIVWFHPGSFVSVIM